MTTARKLVRAGTAAGAGVGWCDIHPDTKLGACGLSPYLASPP
jgi:hypothetical protein